MSKKVFIIPGHGGSDPGAVRYITEKEYTLKTKYMIDIIREGWLNEDERLQRVVLK